MKHIKKFNEELGYLDEPEMERTPVKVKDLVEYFQTLDPEMEVSLDKDGWDYYPTPLETIKKSYLFHVWDHDGKKHLTINN